MEDWEPYPAIIRIMYIIVVICHYCHYACYCTYAYYCIFFCTGWLESIGSRVVYELDYRKPVLYVIPIQSILGKLVVPVGDTGTIPYHLRNTHTHTHALPATAGWVLAMDARCGSSTRGLWVGRGHVMNLKGSQRAATHGEMLHAPSMHTHVWAMLPSALHVLYRFRLFLPAVQSTYKLCPQCAVPYRPCP